MRWWRCRSWAKDGRRPSWPGTSDGGLNSLHPSNERDDLLDIGVQDQVIACTQMPEVPCGELHDRPIPPPVDHSFECHRLSRIKVVDEVMNADQIQVRLRSA